MVYAGIIISLLGGIMAAASLIVQFKADAKAAIEKLTPYQGIIGLVLLGWGIWGVIQIIRAMSYGVLPVIAIVAVAVQVAVPLFVPDWPVGLPPGTSVVFQWWMADGGAICGASASNGADAQNTGPASG